MVRVNYICFLDNPNNHGVYAASTESDFQYELKQICEFPGILPKLLFPGVERPLLHFMENASLD